MHVGAGLQADLFRRHARGDLHERTVIGNHHHFPLNDVAHLQVFAQRIPRVRGELFQAERDTLLIFIEIEDYHVDLIVELHHLFRVLYAAPR